MTMVTVKRNAPIAYHFLFAPHSPQPEGFSLMLQECLC